MTVRSAVVVLAAGRGRRFGGLKQLAHVGGRPLVTRVVDAALLARVHEVVVVLGHHADRVAAAVPEDRRVRIVLNPDYGHGQATSLRTGIAALSPDIEVAAVLLGDVPGVAASAVRAVIAAVADGADAARARYEDGPSHPVAFARRVWPRLLELGGDEGARVLLRDLAVEPVPMPGLAPRDVDVPADLHRIRED